MDFLSNHAVEVLILLLLGWNGFVGKKVIDMGMALTSSITLLNSLERRVEGLEEVNASELRSFRNGRA
ncbi:MAG: hypothetical protein OEV66_12060 [Spirochaetia bacterium]|nr:hypothetical protein [Spirochaetia bacterium]